MTEPTLLTFDDIILIPQMSTLESRSDADTSVKVWKYERPNPIISANMESVTGPDMAIAVWEAGGIGALHRFQTIKENMQDYYKVTTPNYPKGYDCFVSVGVKDEGKLRAKALYKAGARMFIVDIAQGHSVLMEDMIKWMRDKWGDEIFVVGGNIATGYAAKDLCEWGVDVVKVGVGPGCFASNTKVLMANGIYKNISEIEPGEFVINKDGKSVKVLRKIDSGFRKVVKLKTSNWYDYTYVTPDHKYWIGDCRNIAWNSFQSKGIAKLLDQKMKTTPKTSRYKWEKIGNTDKQTLSLSPKNIKYQLPFDFVIDLAQFVNRAQIKEESIKTNGNKEFGRWLRCSYDLGYMFGTFLGDGHARILENGSGVVSWYFGKNEIGIADKLTAILRGYGFNPSVDEKENMIFVMVYNKYLAMTLQHFGKKTEKHLPEMYMSINPKYISGLYDGLIDSDGNIEKNGRECFTNTSKHLAELFFFCSSILGKSYSSHLEKPTAGFECNLDNLNECCKIRTHTSNRFTNDYWYSTLVSQEECETEIQTWDIEVDCPTHSFIANNCIVHNSVCTTRTVTGHGVPQVSAIKDCFYWTKHYDKLLIADGGIRSSGDMVKSFAFGADLIMLGGLLAGTMETPGDIIEGSHGQVKVYMGSASYDRKGVTKEGIRTTVPCKGPVKETIDSLIGGLRSGMSYANARTLKEIYSHGRYKLQSPAAYAEGLPHMRK